MDVEIDAETCQGYLLCVNGVPEVFDEDDIGHGVVRMHGELPPELEERARNAIEECPVGAIRARAARPDGR